MTTAMSPLRALIGSSPSSSLLHFSLGRKPAQMGSSLQNDYSAGVGGSSSTGDGGGGVITVPFCVVLLHSEIRHLTAVYVER